jgi:hypothetical protein
MAPKKTTLKDLRRETATKDDIKRLDTKLTKFEEHEIDKRLHFTTPYNLLKIINN